MGTFPRHYILYKPFTNTLVHESYVDVYDNGQYKRMNLEHVEVN